MNVPILWNLHTAQVPKVMSRGISPTLARAQRYLSRLGIKIVKGGTRNLAHSVVIPILHSDFFVQHPNFVLNWQKIN
jgi:hypothetical protein